MELLLIWNKVCVTEAHDLAQFEFQVLPRGIFELLVITMVVRRSFEYVTQPQKFRVVFLQP